MKCSKCNSEIKDGAKFCTSCGAAVETRKNAAVCPSCSAEVRLDAKFCTTCGKPMAPANDSAKEFEVVKQRIFWNIQQGEIARKINESEFINYDSALGIIINDGTTAYVRCDGKQIAEIHGGSYDFIDPAKLKEILETRVGGVAGELRGGFRFLSNLVLGRRVKDRIENPALAPERQPSFEALVSSMQRGSLMALSLKLDKDFEMVFGAPYEDSGIEPMTIRTKHLDVQVGLRAFFSISDFQVFSTHYLSDRNSVSSLYLAGLLTPLVRAAIQEVMQDYEPDGTVLSAEMVEKIKSRIVAAARDTMHGVTLENIAEITLANEDLERLRTLSRELYLSEKELDYYIRSNEFKNRLSAQTGDQAVYEAQSEHDLRIRLDAINKDNLLHEEEMLKFVELLKLDQQIRQAHNNEHLEDLYAEIEKRGILRKEDIDVIKSNVEQNGYQRGLALALMQQRGQAEVESLELDRVRQARLGKAGIDVDEQRLRDQYSDQARRQSAQTDLEIKAAERRSKLETMGELNRMRQEREDAEHRRSEESLDKTRQHDLQKEKLRLEELDLKYSKAKDMTPQQLMAIAANENLDPVAAAKFAESFSASMSVEMQTKFMEEFKTLFQARNDDKDREVERMERMKREEADRMERILQGVMQNNSAMTGHLVQHKDQQQGEYRERLETQERRMDQGQDRAMDYITRQPAPKGATKKCAACSAVIAVDEKFCSSCGEPCQ